MLADAPHGARVGVDRLGLQTLELEMLQVQLVLSRSGSESRLSESSA